jgi:hypothetical protein
MSGQHTLARQINIQKKNIYDLFLVHRTLRRRLIYSNTVLYTDFSETEYVRYIVLYMLYSQRMLNLIELAVNGCRLRYCY